jgi:hypothetical protein
MFFRLTALTQTTDIARSVAGRTLAAEMGMYAHLRFDELNSRYRHTLELHDFNATKWDVLRQSALRQSDGNLYPTPDRVAELSNEQVRPLIDPKRLAKAEGEPERLAALAHEAKRNLQIDLLAFHADEMNFAVINTDAATQRWTSWHGLRGGTPGGEIARFVMQFKAFPIAFTQRVGARTFFGQRTDAHWVEKGFHIGTMLSMLTVAGYMSGVAKDIRDGYWPPRNPADLRTLMAALLQGGVPGVYGDYLFSKTNRFSQGWVETAIGPTFGSIGDLGDVAMDARDFAFSGGEDRFSGARAFNVAWGNLPFANLWFTKPAIDWLFLNSMRDALSPGYLRRQEHDRRRDYHQERWLPTAAVH